MTEKRNRLREIQAFGQSVWYDNISRDLLESGELRRLVEEDGISGVTSNPTIFEKAIRTGKTYDRDLERLAREGRSPKEAYEALAIDDIRAAADLLREVYERTGGKDGYVSFEVSPHLARDTEGTIAEARRLHQAVGRENVMIKVPATPEGIPAIEELLAEDVPVNVTLMFSLRHYTAVAEAYLRGIERRARAGKPLDRVASVASVFVSRIDTAVDKELEEKPEAREFLGRTGIANAKVIYGKFRELFRGPRFRRLEEKGARVQRPLWASTSTKNPRYSDVLYAEALIGPDTIDTMPPATIEAFRDHGVAANRLETDLEGAKWLLDELPKFGIDLDAVMERLQVEGVEAFARSFDELLATVEAKLAAFSGPGAAKSAK
ncbi:MAG: hypothetical protein KatS3mg076_2379 [Candidatus Binatia bacterium]|nr:MAG: hypothetical protein KatS3mg076_2379 [Candidatus Binatia bacterium]